MSSACRIIRFTTDNSEEAIEAAVTVLIRGGIVALPTDTLYGISTLLPFSEKLYALKKRSREKPLGIFLPNPTSLKLVSKQTIPDELARSLLPGPVTLMFGRLSTLPESFNPGVQNVCCRVPDSPVISKICSRLKQPLAQTSANVSGSPVNPMRVEDFEELIPQIDLVLDNGPILPGSEEGSTIVDLTVQDHFKIVRNGCAEKDTKAKLYSFGWKET